MKSKITCFLFLFLSSYGTLLGQKVSEENYQLKKTGEFLMTKPDSIYLGQPTNIEVLDNGDIVWGEQNRLLFIDKDGKDIEVFQSNGRGPGEFSGSTYFTVGRSGNFAIFSAAQYKISIFDSARMSIGDFYTQKVRLKEFVTINDGNNPEFATFNDLLYQQPEAAVTLFNKQGTIIKEWGQTPSYALLQDVRNGGGITTDLQDNIYYSYLGGYKIWKVNTKTDEVKVFDQKPAYFDQISPEKISSLGRDLQKIIAYSFKSSRVSGLFFYEPDLIIQQIDDGNPWADEAVHIHLELWNTEGKKMPGDITVPHWVADVNKDRIYVYADNAGKLIEKSDQQETVKLFDIYKLVKQEK